MRHAHIKHDTGGMPLPSIPFQTHLEPRRKHKFIAEFPEDLSIESYLVQTIKGPKFKNRAWRPITITIIDTIYPPVRKSILTWIDEHTEDEDYTFNFTLKTIDTIGHTIDSMLLENCKIKKVELSNYDYSSIELCKINLTIKPNRIIIQ